MIRADQCQASAFGGVTLTAKHPFTVSAATANTVAEPVPITPFGAELVDPFVTVVADALAPRSSSTSKNRIRTALAPVVTSTPVRSMAALTAVPAGGLTQLVLPGGAPSVVSRLAVAAEVLATSR